jgi:hypothetical protein
VDSTTLATGFTSKADELEGSLADLARAFRRARDDEAVRNAIALQYGSVFDEFVASVGHFVELDCDSLLPDVYMPKQYMAHKREIAAKGTPKGLQWILRIVPLKFRGMLNRS